MGALDGAVMTLFNEDSLRAAIVDRWGEHGAHVDVFDMLVTKAREATSDRQALADLRERIEQGVTTLGRLMDGEIADDVALRLHGKREGLKVAVAYLDEYLRKGS
jgi:hypothetical protein